MTASSSGSEDRGIPDGPVAPGAPDGVGFLLGVAHRAERRRWEDRLTEVGLTAPQAAVLRLVAAEPGCGVRQIARSLATDPMNARRILGSLVTAGLCEARRDPLDARRRPIHPTGPGADLAAVVTRLAENEERRLASDLGEAVYRELVTTLASLVAGDGRTANRTAAVRPPRDVGNVSRWA